MKPIIVLDSGPLGLLFQKKGIPQADGCRDWLRQHLAAGRKVIVPEIASYELRRELLRLTKGQELAALDRFEQAAPGRYLPLTTPAIRLAAELWAKVRQKGKPTADPHALDGDVILAAQVLTGPLPPADAIVATSNVSHLSHFLDAKDWQSI